MRKLGKISLLLLMAVWAMGVSAPQDTLREDNATSSDSRGAPNTDAHYLDVPDEEVVKLLDDPKERIPKLFKVPAGLRSMVGFWLKIYAKYSLYQTVVYDREHVDIVYEIVDAREWFAKGQSAIAQEINSKARLKKIIAEYRGAIDTLQRNPRARFKEGSAGAKVLKLWGRKSSAQWKTIATNFRTQPGQRDRIMNGISVGDRFFPAMESIFVKNGLPPEITRLPLVESSFNVQAVSKVDAVGVWQFMEKSALEYLIVDSKFKIDERLSPIKSTYAAARMFTRNIRLLKDIGLAIIAYNHGPRNLIKIRDKYKGEDIAKLLNAKKSPLGYASKNFYAEFLAALHAEKYRDVLYGMKKREHSDAISIIKMKKSSSVFDIASLYNISLHELRLFNPDIFDLKRKLPIGTRVVVPRRLGESLVEAKPTEKKADRSIASEVEYIEYLH